jgi:hypothetical protein
MKKGADLHHKVGKLEVKAKTEEEIQAEEKAVL